MTLRLELPPELEERLAREAAQLGLSLDAFALRLLAEHVLVTPPRRKEASGRALEQPVPPKAISARELLALSPEERDRFLSAQAEHAAPIYDADLARPAAERELTAFTALDGEPFLDDE